MSKLANRLSLSKDIRKNFASFYLFGDNSVVKKDLVGKNDLTYAVGSPSVFHGRSGRGEKFSGSSYLVNRSITPNVTGFPFFIYVDVQDTGDASLDGEPISLSPWVSDYTRQIQIFMEGSSTNKVGGILTDLTAPSYPNKSKAIPSRIYTAALVARSYSNFTLFVNGEKLTPFQTLATGFTTKNSFVVGRTSNGGGSFRGAVFSAGWGVIDPGDDFLRRLTVNPTSIIFQKRFYPSKASVVLGSVKSRKTFSELGTKIGSRGV